MAGARKGWPRGSKIRVAPTKELRRSTRSESAEEGRKEGPGGGWEGEVDSALSAKAAGVYLAKGRATGSRGGNVWGGSGGGGVIEVNLSASA